MKVLQHQSNPNTSKRSGFNLVSNQDKTEKDNKIPLRLIGLESLTQYYQMSLLNICTNTLPPSADRIAVVAPICIRLRFANIL